MADEVSGIRKQTRIRRNAAASAAPAPVETAESASPAVEANLTSGPEPEKKRASTLNIPLKADGTIDMENMRESTKEKLQVAIGGAPGIVTGGGIAAKDVAPLYDGLGSIEAWCAVKFFGVPADYARVFLYDAAEKEALAEPTAAILNKYMPAVGKYKDEAQLVFLLYAIHQNKFTLLNATLAKAAAENAARTPAPHVSGPGAGAIVTGSEEVN